MVFLLILFYLSFNLKSSFISDDFLNNNKRLLNSKRKNKYEKMKKNFF